MARRKHNVQALALYLGRPVHVVETWFGPYHQLTLPQVSELERYLDAHLFVLNNEPLPFQELAHENEPLF